MTFASGSGTYVPKRERAEILGSADMSTSDEPISEDQCWELLAATSVGRLALSVRALPVILPVQYYVDGRRIAVCLGHHQIPERSLNQVIIGFTADAIDPVSRSGWFVQVQGRSVIPQRLGADAACDGPATGQIVQIEPGIVSGHRMQLCPLIDALRNAGRPLPTP